MKKNLWFYILFFVICTSVLCSACYAESGQSTEKEMSYQEYLVKEADLPQIPYRPDMSDPSSLNDEIREQYAAWWQAKAEQQETVIPDAQQIQEFAANSTREFVADYEKRNFLYSPVSLWFCLNTLSELGEGNSKAQILQVIGYPPEGEQNTQADAVFKSLYWEDDTAVCIPAISVWLNRSTLMSERLTERLSDAHSAVFQGTMGEEAFDQAFRLWLNEQTRGLLENSVSDLRFSADDGLVVCSTLYMKSGWSMPFSRDKTAPDIFYAEDGEITTDFMHSSQAGVVYRRDGFTAVILDFQDGGGVALILPDAGRSPDELLQTNEVFRFLFSGRPFEDGIYGKIRLAVPKMDCLSDLSLRNALEKMGIADIFDPKKAQFSEEISSDSELAVSALRQYARLILNEDGVEAAAITLTTDGALFMQPEEEIDFTLNRPFIYAVMSGKNLPLFIGTYHMPE